MRLRGLAIFFRIAPLALALAVGGGAHAHECPAPEPQPKASAGKTEARPTAAKNQKKSGKKKKTTKKKKPAKKQSTRKKASAKPGAPGVSKTPLKLDPGKVLTLQMQALEAQYETEEGQSHRPNRFTQRLDAAHRCLYCLMDNAVRRVDLKWLAEEAPYDPELSVFKLRTYSRIGGKSSEKEFDLKVRFRGDIALPGLEQKFHLYVDNAGRDSLPGTDPMKQESDPRLGVTAMYRTLRGADVSLGGGLRWRNSHPVAYASLDWRREHPLGDGTFCLNPRAFYYTDDGLGQQIALTWTRQVGPKAYFQTRTAERSSESRDDVEFEQTLRFAWLRSGRGRGWVAQASVFPHVKSSDWYWDDSLVNVTWRDALYRKWIYYTVTPQIQFPKEDEYDPRPSLRIGLEILFGGKIGDLL